MRSSDIVRALAAIDDPTVWDRDYAPSSECGMCDADDGPDYTHRLDDPLLHEPGCPWRMALEWMDARPARRLARFLCDLLGHRWVQPEGVFTKRWCSRCGALPHRLGHPNATP